MNKSIKKRLEKIMGYAEPGEIICFVFPDGKGTWYVEWNDHKTVSRKDGFQSIDKALEFAESLSKVSNIFYHHREKEDTITIVDEWGGAG